MRILISGATGVIGRRAAPLLLAQGHAVSAIVRSPAAGEGLARMGAICVSADLFDIAALRKVAAGHDAIINLATHMPSAAWKMLFRRSWRLNDRIRTEGSANMADAALSAGVGTLIQESFAPTYPDSGDKWIDETKALEPSAYNRTVLDAEASTARCARGVTSRMKRCKSWRKAAPGFAPPHSLRMRAAVTPSPRATTRN